MSGYKLVPVEPVAWVTADTVDGQTVNGKPRRIWWENNEGVGIPIYAAPQPAEQKPTISDEIPARTTFGGPQRFTTAEQQPSAGDSLTPVPDEVFAAEFAAWWEEHGQFCRAGGGTYEQSFAFEAWRHLYPQLMNLQMAAAEHQPVPNVAALVEALELALEYWRHRQQRYRNRRPKWVIAAESALAAQRKGAQP